MKFDNPDDAISALADHLAATAIEEIDGDWQGRVLAEPILADRDSPAADVSAMDGYAVNESDFARDGTVNVASQSVPGSPPPSRDESGVIRIFTGAIVPSGCDRVIQREQTVEIPADESHSLGQVTWTDQAKQNPPGTNIRRRGENLTAGSIAVPVGVRLTSPRVAAMVNFGVTSCQVHRPVRVAIVTTGDELARNDSSVLPPWQIRNSNAAALAGLLAHVPFIEPPTRMHSVDEPNALRETIDTAITDHEVLLMTGGVSMGDFDYVPRVLREIGAEIIFHKLPLRPGKPILGAIHVSGNRPTLILGLPGNPVSATMGARRFAMPLIEKIAGVVDWRPKPPHVVLNDVGDKTLPLHWMRGVRMIHPGVAELVIGQGSGDVATLAQTDGFIEMPPGAAGTGPWPYFAW